MKPVPTTPQLKVNSYLGSGIGRDCALGYAAEGAAGVAFADLDESAALSAAEESVQIATNPNYRQICIKVDVSDLASVEGMVEDAVKCFGRIDYSVNSAGVWPCPILSYNFCI